MNDKTEHVFAAPVFLAVAVLLFAMAIIALIFVRLVVAIFQGDTARITQLVGARSLEEEVAEEMAHAEAELAREHQLIDRGDD